MGSLIIGGTKLGDKVLAAMGSDSVPWYVSEHGNHRFIGEEMSHRWRDTPWLEINEQKVVCMARPGECRNNNWHYSSGMRSDQAWSTPFVLNSCPNSCPYKYLVCRGLGHSEKCHGHMDYDLCGRWPGMGPFCRHTIELQVHPMLRRIREKNAKKRSENHA